MYSRLWLFWRRSSSVVLVAGLVIILDEMVGKSLGSGNVGDCEDFGADNCRVVVFGSSCDFGSSLDLIIATCHVFRHLRTLEKADDPRVQLSLADFVYAVGKLGCCVLVQWGCD